MTSFPWKRPVGLAMVVVIGLATSAGAKDGASPSPDQLAIEQSAEKFVAAFNKHVLADLAALFAEDAEYLPRGEDPVEGREEIQELFAASFEANPKLQISLSLEAIRLVTSDVAIEEGVTVSFADGETPTTRSRYSVVHVKQKGGWRMKLVRELEEEPLSPYAGLRELEWMIGEWVDEGADSVVSTSCRWDEKKRFLLRSFEVKTRGDVVLKGEQRIGWDAVSKQIRSWTFDDDGGFVEGHWTQVDDRWVIKSAGFRPDGQPVSMTQIVTALDHNRLEWKMESRLLGEEPLPPLTVILARRAPQPTAAK